VGSVIYVDFGNDSTGPGDLRTVTAQCGITVAIRAMVVNS
jgi:hypothetical protein